MPYLICQFWIIDDRLKAAKEAGELFLTTLRKEKNTGTKKKKKREKKKRGKSRGKKREKITLQHSFVAFPHLSLKRQITPKHEVQFSVKKHMALRTDRRKKKRRGVGDGRGGKGNLPNP